MAPQKSKAQNLSYKLDGHFQSNEETYKAFLKKLKKIDQDIIEKATLKKLYAALRYLRLGAQSNEQEHKLLNYWIAIEYLYSTADIEANKVDRLKEYFNKIHSYAYVRAQFYDLHNSIKQLKATASISHFSETDITYLLLPATAAEIERLSSRYPLLYFRFHTLKISIAATKQYEWTLNAMPTT